jgi:tRNA U38,U39,U40 pseudouridine synthase TruA
MATQPNTPTVEAEVHRALHASGAISDSNNGDRNKVARACTHAHARMHARTHARTHARHGKHIDNCCSYS